MSHENILSILKDLNPSRAAGIDNLSGKFLEGFHFLLQFVEVMKVTVSVAIMCMQLEIFVTLCLCR